VIVRQISVADATSLHQTCFSNHSLRQVQDHLRWCLSEQEKGRLVCWVIEVGGHVVASGQLALLQGKAEIGSLIVAPGHRRQGIGTALVQALIEQARQRQVHTIELTANVDYPWIRAWYERLGFAFQREHDFPGERVAILTMNLTQGDPT
jgi:ribosomal protein S18 acetylase RimI-like enzyme